MKAALDTLWASIVRTVIPIAIGAVTGWLAAASIPVDPEFADALQAVLSLALGSVYYVAVRLFETHVSPKFAALLGSTKQPSYGSPVTHTQP